MLLRNNDVAKQYEFESQQEKIDVDTSTGSLVVARC